MFDPAKTFLLGRRDQLSITDQARGESPWYAFKPRMRDIRRF
jgi:hypothetical protein